jgi:hypothetical protein
LAFLEIHLKENRSYRLTLEKPANACYFEPDYQYTFAKGDKSFDFKYVIANCANIVVKVKNVNCLGELDEFSIDMKPNIEVDYTAFLVPNKYGCYENSFIEEKIPACNWIVLWSITRNNIKESHEENFTLGENEHKILEINY